MLKEFETLNSFMRYANELNKDEQIVDDVGIMLYQSTISKVTSLCRVFRMNTDDSQITFAFNADTHKIFDINERMVT